MLDVGLGRGFLKLYQDQLFRDYTIKVGEQEYKVHKVVLAAVSDYFKVMFSGTLVESKTDRVVLNGLNPQTVSRLVELVYTGDEQIVAAHAAELLGCAAYLQMTSIIKLCTEALIQEITVNNCLLTLSKFLLHALQEGADTVRAFIKSNWQDVIERCPHEEVSLDVLLYIINEWTGAEWALFLFVKKWISADYDNRKVHVNDLMSRVRFSLMSPLHIASVREMNPFPECAGTWYDLLDRATEYQNRPMHLKVIDSSDQTTPRHDGVLVLFNVGSVVPNPSIYVLPTGARVWSTEPMPYAPKLEAIIKVIEVNDFMIVCTMWNEAQKWHIFDARTKAWSTMAGMRTVKTHFALVYHDQQLYALGGERAERQHPDEATDGIERYSFETNKWHSIYNLPAAAKYLSACVLGGGIYVSGGRRKSQTRNAIEVPYSAMANLDCLDPQTGTWERKAPMSVPMEDHEMHTMKLNNEDVIVTINRQFHALYYKPHSNMWTDLTLTHPPILGSLELQDVSIITTRGNSMYFLNINAYIKQQDGDGQQDRDRPSEIHGALCVMWQLPKTGDVIRETLMPFYPISETSTEDSSEINDFAAILKM